MSDAIAYYQDEPIYFKDISYQLYLLENKDRPTAVLQSLLVKDIAERAKAMGLKYDADEIETKILTIKENQDLNALLNVTDRDLEGLKQELINGSLLEIWLNSEHEIIEEDFEKFYEERFKGIKMPERVHLRHVLIMFDPQRKGEDHAEIQEQMKQVEAMDLPFEDKAMKYSECVSATNRGDLGWVQPKDLFPEISKAISTLKVGDPPVLVESEIGIHLVELLEQVSESELSEEESRKTARKKYNELKNRTELRYILEAIKRDIRYVGE